MDSSIEETEICIIGAGPAGAAASLTLSKLGIAHTIVDAATFPRHKACGDIITSGVVRVLNELDPSIVSALRKDKILNPIWKTLCYPPNGKPIHIDFLPFNRIPNEPSCYAVSRFDLDYFLIKKIQESRYAVLKQNYRIASLKSEEEGMLLVAENGERMLAKLIIVATGSKNSTLKLLGLEQPKSDCAIGIRAIYENIEGDQESTELFLDNEIMPGGFYITPFVDNKFNVNLVMSLEKVNKGNMNLRETFERLLEKNPLLKQKFSKAVRISNFEGSQLFLGIHRRIISGNRFLVVGDSAGLIDIISGNGIPQAMESGKRAALKAAEAIGKSDFSKEFLSNFEEELYHKIGKSLALGKFLYPILRYNFFNRMLLKGLNYISNRPQSNFLLRDLLYHQNVKRRLIDPRFYYNLLLAPVKKQSPSMVVKPEPQMAE